MEENKIDNIIKEKFDNRILTPSVSSWERMENMLDEKKGSSKKKRYYFLGIAASIAVVLSIYFGTNKSQIENMNSIPVNKQIIVTAPEKPILNSTEEIKEVNNDIIKKFEETNVVASTIKKVEDSKLKESLRKEKSNELSNIKILENRSFVEEKFKVALTESDSSVVITQKNSKQQVKNSRIRVNGEDLLYAVTHSPNEVKEYYANLKLDRNDVLDSIKTKLKKSNLKINPEVILAEVERSIEDDTYQGNFKNNLGRRISTIIVAVANRNK